MGPHTRREFVFLLGGPPARVETGVTRGGSSVWQSAGGRYSRGMRSVVKWMAVVLVGGGGVWGAAGKEGEGEGVLTVRVADLRNHKGDLIFGVFKSAEGFPNVKEK